MRDLHRVAHAPGGSRSLTLVALSTTLALAFALSLVVALAPCVGRTPSTGADLLINGHAFDAGELLVDADAARQGGEQADGPAGATKGAR